jgi:hypothetical protein
MVYFIKKFNRNIMRPSSQINFINSNLLSSKITFEKG